MKIFSRFLTAIATLTLSGCLGGIALHHDFDDYSRVYADSTNKQLLLNLARLSKDEPPYFIQLNTISAGHTFTGQLQYQPTYVNTGPHFGGDPLKNSQKTLTSGGSVAGTDTENPVFSFVPLNGDTFAKAIYNPIDIKIFLTLIEQDQPADEIARILIESVDIPYTAKDRSIKHKIYINDPCDDSYPDFLQLCHTLRQDQKEHKLSVVKYRSPEDQAATTLLFPKENTKLGDVAFAKQSGLNVTNSGSSFALSSDPSQFILKTSGSSSTNTEPSPTVLSKITSFNFERAPIETAQESKHVDSTATIKMRSFIRILESVAKEKHSFNHCNPDVTDKPILDIEKPEGKDRSEILVSISYKGQTYAISDTVSGSGDLKYIENTHYTNHSVFKILCELFTQITIDPKLLPVQQTVRVQ